MTKTLMKASIYMLIWIGMEFGFTSYQWLQYGMIDVLFFWIAKGIISLSIHSLIMEL